MVLVKLRALPEAGEILREDCAERPDVTIDAGDVISLGRNTFTQIADREINRKACCVEITADGLLCVQRIKCRVWVNNTVLSPGMKQTLKEGDKISLSPHQQGKYSYQVLYTNTSTGATHRKHPPKRGSPSRKRSATEVLSSTPSCSSTLDVAATPLPQSALDEFYCAVCLDLQAEATTIVPCGHSFCQACIAQATKCPSCRASIVSRVPCRSLSNVLSSLSKTGAFPTDDVTSYQQRTCTEQPSKSRTRSKKEKQAMGESANTAIRID